MAFFMAAMAIGSLLSSNSARNAKMKAQAADAKLQRARLETARTRSTDTLTSTERFAKKATQQREVQIEENRLDAESKVDEVFAGSGISGTSVNEIDAEIDADVSRSKQANLDVLDQQLSNANKTYSEQIEDTNNESKNINTTAPKQDILGDVTAAISSAKDFSSTVKGFTKSKDKKIQNLGRFLGF